MRNFILLTLVTLLFPACTNKTDFNIVSAEVDIDTAQIKLKYDTFQTTIKDNLLTKVDTTNLWTSLESLTDTSLMIDWNKESMDFAVAYFETAIKELDKPNIVRSIEEEAIHFSVLSKDYWELEISNKRLLFSRNKDEVKSKSITNELSDRVAEECNCQLNDNLNYILLNSQGNQIYRLDITGNNEYKYCWKVLRDGDILNQLIEEAEKYK